MKKVPFYVSFFLFCALTVFGQKQTDPEIRKAIEIYESEISKALSASEYYDMLDNYHKIIILYEKHNLNQLKLVDYYVKAGQVAYELKEYKKALKYQEKALVIQEQKLESIDIVTSYQDIIKTCKALKLHIKAVKYQEQIITILKDKLDSGHPDLAIAYGEIGLSYEAARKYQSALEYFEKAVDMLGNNEQYQSELDYYRASIDAMKEKLEERGQLLNIAPKPDYTNGTFYSKERASYSKEGTISVRSTAYNFFQEKNYEEALPLFNKLNEEAETGQNWTHIAFCHYYLGNYTKSIEAHEKSVLVAPDIKSQYHYHSNIGLVYAKNRQFEEAETAFEAFDELSTSRHSQPALHYRNWGMFYALQDEKYEAIENLKKAIKWQFRDVEWLENDDSLDNIREEKAFKSILKKAEKNHRRPSKKRYEILIRLLEN